jgi:excinuclease ABC subunit C
LLQRVRDETHRVAITYHRTLHRKAATRSKLDDVPGIGPKRKKALLQEFGSLKRLREASVDEIAAVPGMNREVAQRVLEHLGGRL